LYGTLYGMPAQRLTPDRITAEALALVDEAGADALTMRALADRLGVGTMTVYGYFRSRDDLLDAAVDAATATAVDAVPATAPHAELAALFTAFHQVLAAHPGLVRLRAARPFLSPGALRLTDRAVGALLALGHTPAAAVRAYRTLYLFTLGCAAFAAQDPAAVRTALAPLPPATYPHLTAVAPDMAATAGSPGEFHHGLSAMIATVTPAPRQGPGVPLPTPPR
jgi:AcrR family transcriptional regulator